MIICGQPKNFITHLSICLMKNKILLITLVLVSININAQKAKTTLIVDKRFHDFGKIKEDGGKVTAVFTFTNTGNSNLLIEKVEPSCGCTLGEYTKEPIPPGKTGTVTAIYNPKNQIGIIDKTVGVYTNAYYASIVVLELRGEVIPRDKSMSDIFPYRVGNMMFDKEIAELGDVFHNVSDSAYIVMYNDGQYPIKINNVSVLPKGYRVYPSKNVIEPNEEAKLFVVIEANTIKDFGVFNKNFRLLTDDQEIAEKPLMMLGNLKYNFGKLSKKDKKAAPKFKIDKKEYDFGDRQIGLIVENTFTITNNGKNNLEILALKSQCSCTKASIDKYTIKKGEQAKLTITFDLLGHAGITQKPVTIYTNDPKNPIVDIIVKANLY
ncbi:MAG: DUF1573 domain-containing protein [Bacteroidia bacterium]|nr:DUF1573 domain-containing protein [Bacteroidia bacterium]